MDVAWWCSLNFCSLSNYLCVCRCRRRLISPQKSWNLRSCPHYKTMTSKHLTVTIFLMLVNVWGLKWNCLTWYFSNIRCWNEWRKRMWAWSDRGRRGDVGGGAVLRHRLWEQMPLPLPWHCWPVRWAASSSPWLPPHTASPPLPEPPPAHSHTQTHTLLLATALPAGWRGHARVDGHHGRRTSQLQWRTCHR